MALNPSKPTGQVKEGLHAGANLDGEIGCFWVIGGDSNTHEVMLLNSVRYV